jgi:hypothetical protein
MTWIHQLNNGLDYLEETSSVQFLIQEQLLLELWERSGSTN